MSCNYADGLSTYENKGKLGLPEIIDEPHVVTNKVKLLAEWIKIANHVVCHTGAGISTSAGIPDFRGPAGVWTLEKKGEKPVINTSFDSAEPTLTHMILKGLAESGQVKFIISQNIDGLHLRSGLKRTSMAELHGNMFVAKCNFCGKFVVQRNAAPTVGEKEIGQNCPSRKPGGRNCRGKLIDTLLDWEANLPELELESATLHSSLADLSICFGTTLQIVPAGNLPLKSKNNSGGKLVIINLQPTKHDKKADLIIHAKVDAVMSILAQLLEIPIMNYCPTVDPTRLLQQNNLEFLDWTISAASIKRLRAEVALSRKVANMNKTKSETKTNRKRNHRSVVSEIDNTRELIPVKKFDFVNLDQNQLSIEIDCKPII